MMKEINKQEGSLGAGASLEAFNKSLQDLIAVIEKSQSRLRCNRLVLERFISHFQKSLGFWGQLRDDYESSYNQKGDRVSRGASSRVNAQV